ncbi:TetR/AcrR family transcriptional regulator [Eubacteriales bacterium OttesenSCG-928-A19]|nr:TetR/AcrR family transcriptional regulator [Eubacteriales bacterium OttesenSCG-928-A19]
MTEREKGLQRERLLAKSRRLVIARGLQGVSVDDIVSAAGMAKGTFYHHFASKESLLRELAWRMYQRFVGKAVRMIQGTPEERMPDVLRAFFRSLISEPEPSFFLANHQELERVWGAGEKGAREFAEMELAALEKLIMAAGLDTAAVSPAVVHNYLHAMYFASTDGVMLPDACPDALEALLGGLMAYMLREGKQ